MVGMRPFGLSFRYSGLLLIAGHQVDDVHLVRQLQLLERDRDLAAVRRRRRVQIDHRAVLRKRLHIAVALHHLQGVVPPRVRTPTGTSVSMQWWHRSPTGADGDYSDAVDPRSTTPAPALTLARRLRSLPRGGQHRCIVVTSSSQAFRKYWQTGAVGEDWDAWSELFTEDADYIEHVLGNLKGREAIRAWIKPIMEQYGELYTVYEWHSVDPEAGRVIVYMQNRRDHPSGQGFIDFPGITILDYAGNGLWKREEDYWAVPGATQATEKYATARKQLDPDHKKKHTRLDWGNGPTWTRGGRTYFDHPNRAK